MVLQMSKTTGWDDYLGTLGMNPICQDPHAHCYQCHPPAPPHPFSVTVGLPVVVPEDSLQSPWRRIRVVAPTKQTQCWRAGAFCPPPPPQVLFFHWRSQRLREHLFVWRCTGLQEKQCGQCKAGSLTLLMQSVWVSAVQGVL